jgi:hypothetical protein
MIMRVRIQLLAFVHSWSISTGRFDHPPYSPDIAPSDCHLFTYLKNWLGSQRFNNNEQLMEGVKMWMNSQAADFFDTGIQKFILLYKCLNSGGDYVEK